MLRLLCLNTLNPSFDLTQFLATLNLFTRFAILGGTSNGFVYVSDARDWLQKIRINFELGIEQRNSKINATTTTPTTTKIMFAEMTSASLLFLEIEAELSNNCNYTEKYTETNEFLNCCSKWHTKQEDQSYKDAFDLLASFVSSLNDADIFDETMENILHKLR